MGIYGVLLSNFIVSGSLFLLTLPAILKRIKSSTISVLAWKKMMRFGLPFLPSGIFAMIMELADRYILKEMTDLTTVGIYSAGYKLGMLMMLIVMGFNMGWQPFFLKSGSTTEQKPLFSRITTYVLAILGFIWIILLVWVDDIVRIQLGNITVYGVAYWASTNIVPWVALGYVFHGLYLLQLPGIFNQEKSIWVAITRAIGALSNVGLNIYLIPYYGAIGAAIATCISFMVMAVILFSVNRTIYPIDYEWSRLLKIAILMITVYLLHVVSSHDLFVKVMLTLFYPVGLTMVGFFNYSEREWIRRSLSVWPDQSN
jgi:O-antigen/teichoic acid export membrane protein